ncbi:ATPase, T2SS/T4P/T4SS family [Metasolibacillus meyeri]|uniref:ATPase, T2SS/T4P/T4SS family n=1 Tax=Metasolibacillus meyeri TaxID=1071052 RepID=A0AAW9NNG3_9BACL|nr:ATPase, T2SS/T4P/T4SS family [Metasolibacillus meyeri]MEC1177269.1 ATPase, T2SS/T4P/T4SS family [Metasolibacillus meyeri]
MNTEEQRIHTILSNSFLGPYLDVESITDIKFNGTRLRIKDNERAPYYPKIQPTEDDVKKLIKLIADVMGQTFTYEQLRLNTEIGILRISASHKRISPEGTVLSVRISRPRLAIRSVESLVGANYEVVEQLFRVLMLAELSIVLSGRTNAGKTEFQKLLVGYMHDDASIFLIEDTRDSHIKALYPERDIISLKTIKDVYEMSEAVKDGLRNDPDYLMPAEVRGGETADALDAVKTDHAVIITIHAPSAMDIPLRAIPMIRQSPSYTRASDVSIGNEIVRFFRFGAYLKGERNKEQKTIRYLKELVEFDSYTEKGAEGRYVYRVIKELDPMTGLYVQKQHFGKLSDRTLEELEDKELVHLVPPIFLSDDYIRKLSKAGVLK